MGYSDITDTCHKQRFITRFMRQNVKTFGQ